MVISEASVHLSQDLSFQFKTEASLAEGHQDSQGPKDLPQEEKLKLVQHGEDMAFRRSWRMEPVLHDGMIRNNEQKLKKDKVRLDLRKNFLQFGQSRTDQNLRNQKILLREIVQSLEVFKTKLYTNQLVISHT